MWNGILLLIRVPIERLGRPTSDRGDCDTTGLKSETHHKDPRNRDTGTGCSSKLSSVDKFPPTQENHQDQWCIMEKTDQLLRRLMTQQKNVLSYSTTTQLFTQEMNREMH